MSPIITSKSKCANTVLQRDTTKGNNDALSRTSFACESTKLDGDCAATLTVCRACLAMGVKMYNMLEHKLSIMYAEVTGMQVNAEDKLPQMLCWECVARLLSAKRFTDKALKAQWVLLNQINSSKFITINDIKSIDIHRKELKSSLGHNFLKVNESNMHIIEPNDTFNHGTVKEKEFDDLTNNHELIQRNENHQIDEQKIVQKSEISSKLVKIKVEEAEADMNKLEKSCENEVVCKIEECFFKSEEIDIPEEPLGDEVTEDIFASKDVKREYTDVTNDGFVINIKKEDNESVNEMSQVESRVVDLSSKVCEVTLVPRMEDSRPTALRNQKRMKWDSYEDQDNVVRCEVSQNLENVQLEQNQFLTQQPRFDEESRECITPKVIISKNEDTPFCHFKANDTHNCIHLRETHFTPSFSDDEKKKEDETEQKQKNKEYSKRYRDKKRTSIVKENEETTEKKRERNREYQRAWRQRKKDLRKKVSKEEKEEKKRKRHRENQRAYYHRSKRLKENEKKLEEMKKNLDDLQMIRKKLDGNEDQGNQFLSQQLRIYEESHECITPKVILHRNTDIPGDGNCLFHSLIHVLRLQMLTCDLRRQLRDSPYLNSCHNPQEAYNILSGDNEYGDLDCLYLFAKIYNQNICVHYHYFNVITKNEDTRFCHFKANDTHNWIHLDLRGQHFTPYLSDDEKKKEDERKQKQKNKEYSKRYRDKKRKSNLQRGPSARDVLDVLPVIHTSQIAGPSTADGTEISGAS